MPLRFAMEGAGGENVSPPYRWSDAPEATASFVLVVIDAHPVAHGWVHWAVADVPAGESVLPEGASGRAMPSGSVELENTFGFAGWGGPQPPRGTGAHDYRATVYALDTAVLGVRAGSSAADLMRAMEGHVLATASVSGLFER